MAKLYDKLTKQYPVSKTLSLELKPVGETRNTIRKNWILEMDEALHDNFTKVKELINEVHKQIISEVLENKVVLSNELLEELYTLQYETICSEERMEEIKLQLRKEVAEAFYSYPVFKNLFGKELFIEVLPKYVKAEDDLIAVSCFDKLVSMFQGFNEIKKSMYSAEMKHSTIPYRIVHENLPRFLNNIRLYRDLKERNIEFNANMTELENILGIPGAEFLFTVEGFNVVLAQKGIDWYNQVIGGVSTETGKVKGLNECINLWNQQNPREKKLPLFTQLYKQILSDSNTCSFVIDAFENDDDVLTALTGSYTELATKILGRTDGMTYQSLFQNIDAFDMNGICVKDTDINNLSYRFCGRFRELEGYFSKKYDADYKGRKKPGTEKYEEEKRKEMKKVKERSLEEIRIAFLDNPDNSPYFIDWIKNQAAAYEADTRCKASAMLSGINSHRKDISVRQHEELVSLIKDYLDAVKKMQWLLKLFSGAGMNAEKDMVFYSEYNALNDRFVPFTTLYNKVRNYVTRKPFSREKIKLNFESPSLLAGWSVTKESTNLCMLFRKEGQIYLGIAEKNNTSIFKELEKDSGEGECYEKMEYHLLPGPNKMLPKVCFSAKGMADFQPSDEICTIYRKGTFKKGPDFSLSDCHKLIDFYKEAIGRYEVWAPFNFKFSDTKSYRDISDFFREITEQGYRVDFRNVSASVINTMVSEGRMYLFQIWRKDFGEHSKGNLDLQSIYFKMLFDERNLADVIYKLNGEAEIFYQKASIDIKKTPIHRANEPVANKNPRNPMRQSLFAYDIIKNRRYTEEKFLFHVPVTMNFKADNEYGLNAEVDNSIREAEELHFIGINRGERNLLYVVVMNQMGKIKEQFSLNTICNTYRAADGRTGIIDTDYHELLDRREKERDAAQENWQDMDSIKDLKRGYLGQVVHVIAQLAVKYNAMIIMEDLSSVFVNRRKKIEKSIYQEFEGALLKKLNYLIVDKNRELLDVHEAGNALRAYQLTGKFESFSKIGYRSGIVFYVSPWNTSNMDPTTGFSKLFSTKYENMVQAKKLLANFDAIHFNAEKDYFEISFDYKNFGVKPDAGNQAWTVCTYGRRLERYRNPDKNDLKNTADFYPTEEMKNLFYNYGIEYVEGENILGQILQVSEASFFKELLYIITMTMQMYNYTEGFGTGSEEFFQSCVMNSAGEFYNSLTAESILPQCGDAITAYHIAKKGLLLAERIRNTSEGEKVSLAVRNEEWLDYIRRTL